MSAAKARLEELAALYPFPEDELRRLNRRKWILHSVPRKAGTVGAEIGVFRGHFSQFICEHLKPRKLYLVDSWTLFGETFGWGADEPYTNMDRLPTAVAKEEALLRCGLFDDIDTVTIEGWFPGCEDRIAEKLDWAYLDAGHQYEHTLNELRVLDGLMARNGVILGDDWTANPKARHHGVFRAVQAFTRESGWRIIAAGPAAQWALKRCAD